MTENEIGEAVIGSAIRMHRAFGPGLLESAYETCLAYDIEKLGLGCKRQVVLPLIYDNTRLDAGYRIDLLIEGRVVVEVKAVEKLTSIHEAQILSYLKLGGFRLGYLMNFNLLKLKDGIRRVVNGL